MAYETIKIGSASEEILKIKQILKALEYKITSVDPTFDYQSKIALEAFQNDMGISTQGTNMSKTMQKLESFYRQRFPKDDHQLFTTQQASIQNLTPTIVPEEVSPTPVDIETKTKTTTMKDVSPDIIKTEAPPKPQRKNPLASIEEIDVGIRFNGPPAVQSFFEQEQYPAQNDLAIESLFVHSSSCCYDDYLESVLFNETDLLPQENQPMIASLKKREHIPFENNTNMTSTERLVTSIEKKYANMHFSPKNI